MKTHSIFGPPGTGKTRRLEGLIAEFAAATPNIAVMSFTRAAAAVLTNRVKRDNKIRFIGTTHALCYQTLSLQRSQVVNVDNFIKFIDMDEQETKWALNVGQYAKRNGVALDSAYVEFASARMDCPYGIVEFINETYDTWKSDACLVDFDDMLKLALGEIDPFDIVVVDEAQDPSKIQWGLIQSIVSPKGRLVLAGDDDQSIFTWAGAYTHGMRELADTVEVLSQSWRIPRTVHQIAESTIRQVTDRQEKEYTPREEDGYVDILPEYEPLSMLREKGTHTVLCRDQWAIGDIETDLVALGLPYLSEAGRSSFFSGQTARIIRAIQNEDIAALQRNLTRLLPEVREEVNQNKVPRGDWKDIIDLSNVPEEEISYLDLVDLDADPQITLSTIHSFKGKEDDHIVLIGTCTQLVEAAIDNPLTMQDEIRVWYVGLTRAKQGLTLVGQCPFIPV